MALGRGVGVKRWCVCLFRCALFKECQSVCCKQFREEEEIWTSCDVGGWGGCGSDMSNKREVRDG